MQKRKFLAIMTIAAVSFPAGSYGNLTTQYSPSPTSNQSLMVVDTQVKSVDVLEIARIIYEMFWYVQDKVLDEYFCVLSPFKYDQGLEIPNSDDSEEEIEVSGPMLYLGNPLFAWNNIVNANGLETRLHTLSVINLNEGKIMWEYSLSEADLRENTREIPYNIDGSGSDLEEDVIYYLNVYTADYSPKEGAWVSEKELVKLRQNIPFKLLDKETANEILKELANKEGVSEEEVKERINYLYKKQLFSQVIKEVFGDSPSPGIAEFRKNQGIEKLRNEFCTIP